MARSTNLIVPEVATAESIRRFSDNVNTFNAAVGNCIQLSYDTAFLNANGGDFKKPMQLAMPSSVDTHADEADPDTADTAATIAHKQGSWPNQARRALLAYTRDELTRGKFSQADYSLAIGQFIADAKLKALRDVCIGAIAAAIDSADTTDGSTASANIHILDVARGKAAGARVKLTYPYLHQTMAKMGDAIEKIRLFVMHSANFYDLVQDNIANYKIDSVAGAMLVSGVPAAMGRQILVVDSTSLYTVATSTYYTKYSVLGLGAGAVRAVIVSEDQVDQDTIITNKVKKWVFRQDYDVRFEIEGMKWTTTTPVNPTDAELLTAGSWDENYSDHRAFPAVKGIFNSSSGFTDS